jgi:catechol 2,3-dioxygenase-like lactoylglutathione lyase family enzyme
MTDPAFQVTGHATVLHVKDMPAALAYYRDKLGFTVTFTWDDPPRYICLRLGEAAIHLNAYVPPAGWSHIAIFCRGVDALYSQLIGRGVSIEEPIADHPYGMRDFAVIDPDGHRLVFGQGISEH